MTEERLLDPLQWRFRVIALSQPTFSSVTPSVGPWGTGASWVGGRVTVCSPIRLATQAASAAYTRDWVSETGTFHQLTSPGSRAWVRSSKKTANPSAR